MASLLPYETVMELAMGYFTQKKKKSYLNGDMGLSSDLHFVGTASNIHRQLSYI